MQQIPRPLLEAIDSLIAEKPRVLIAIDGPCASGKTTLAATLSERYQALVLHMDDFFLQPYQRTPERLAQPGGNVDAERFLETVLTPLKNGQPFAYQPYSCKEQRLMAPIPMEAAPVTIIEGSYSLHPLLEDAYDLRILTQIDPVIQRERILHRDGKEKLIQFEQRWIPLENRYFEQTNIPARCDLLIAPEWNSDT